MRGATGLRIAEHLVERATCQRRLKTDPGGCVRVLVRFTVGRKGFASTPIVATTAPEAVSITEIVPSV